MLSGMMAVGVMMMIEVVEILLGACMKFCPEQYQEYVLAFAPPVFVLVILVFTCWLVGWFAKTVYTSIIGRRGE